MKAYFCWYPGNTWWRHQMEPFSAFLAICAGNSPVPGEFPAQRPVTRSFDVFFDLRSNKRLSKQWRGWWFEMQSCPLWRHRNENVIFDCSCVWPDDERDWDKTVRRGSVSVVTPRYMGYSHVTQSINMNFDDQRKGYEYNPSRYITQ